MQRSVRENIALPFTAPLRSWGLIDVGAERRRVKTARSTGCRSTRAPRARYAGCPAATSRRSRSRAGSPAAFGRCSASTRRAGSTSAPSARSTSCSATWPAAGAAVLLYTSELKEIQLACDRAIVIFSGRVVAEIPVEEADEATLLRAAYDLPPDAPMPEDVAATELAAEDRDDERPRVRRGRRRERPPDRRVPSDRVERWARRNRWTLGLFALLAGFLVFTTLIQPGYGAPEIQNLAIGALPIAFAAVAQAIVVISGGIDLSVGSMMALTSVDIGRPDEGPGEGFAVGVVIGVLLLGVLVGAINGSIIVITRVPDIVVTLAMSFVWAGATLLVLDYARRRRGGLVQGPDQRLDRERMDPRALVVLVVVVGVVWIPLRRSTLGLSLYAIGSDRLAAFRSGVSVGRTKIIAYALTGLFCALGGLALTASTGFGSPVPGAYTLQSVAAIVLGGVSLAGGRVASSGRSSRCSSSARSART